MKLDMVTSVLELRVVVGVPRTHHRELWGGLRHIVVMLCRFNPYLFPDRLWCHIGNAGPRTRRVFPNLSLPTGPYEENRCVCVYREYMRGLYALFGSIGN